MRRQLLALSIAAALAAPSIAVASVPVRRRDDGEEVRPIAEPSFYSNRQERRKAQRRQRRLVRRR